MSGPGLHPRTIYDQFAERLPVAAASRLDWWAHAKSRGPNRSFNDQEGRRQIVKELVSAIDFTCALETGSYRGSSTVMLAELIDAPVASVECRARNQLFASRRLEPYPHASSELGDSRQFLERRLTAGSGPIFIYLDAHWYDDLPLADELRIIGNSGRQAVVMIDDFRVDDDPGYGYDDYGPGKALDSTYLSSVPEILGWARFVPSLPSSRETGARRGCVVVVHPELASLLGGLPSLRRSANGQNSLP